MRRLLFCAPFLVAASLRAEEVVPAPLSEKEFTDLHARIAPDHDVAWERIDWRLDLVAARAEALRDEKPLFLWSLSGHPLGCS